MGPPSCVRSVVDRNVVMRRIPVDNSQKDSPPKILYAVHVLVPRQPFELVSSQCQREVPKQPLDPPAYFTDIFVFRQL